MVDFNVEAHLAQILSKPPLDPENVANARFQLKVDNPSDPNHDALKADIRTDLCTALDLTPEAVSVESIQAETVVVRCKLMGPSPATTKEIVARWCEHQGNEGGALAKGKVTNQVDFEFPLVASINGKSITNAKAELESAKLEEKCQELSAQVEEQKAAFDETKAALDEANAQVEALQKEKSMETTRRHLTTLRHKVEMQSLERMRDEVGRLRDELEAAQAYQLEAQAR